MKIAVLFSGGVDSSVALKLLKDQGHDVVAFYLKIWLEDDFAFLGSCPWQEDLKYAMAVCEQLRVPLETVNMQKEYWDRVVSYTIDEVKTGRTPSPDIFCNKRIKFGAFFEKIEGKFDKVATGHYAILEKSGERFVLKKAKDKFKDQTYFLSHLNQKQLSKLLFPIGHLTKSEIRKLAERYNLSTSKRKDSQGICFLGKIKFSDFIEQHLGVKKGMLLDFETNEVLGEHDGFWFYTVGQRKGIRLSGGPWYVVKKIAETNTVYISNKYFSPEKVRNCCKLEQFNWLCGKVFKKERLTVKIRHGEQVYDCLLKSSEKETFMLFLDGNDQGLAPGQFAVLYDGDVCLGCGKIS